MTDDEIRIVIAEACGWQKCTVRENGDLIGIPPDHTKYVHIGGSNDWAFVPNYTGDLNAMHEAESRLNALDNLLDPKDGEETEWDRYVYNLEQVILKTSPEEHAYAGIIHATARQRCEAFIKTVCPEKWRK